ncbi:MAG TPA: prepilin-type N-terminal cleavage/methylation domain-containing protein [Humisphaera sp.]
MKPLRPNGPRDRGAFTLVELLVVIGIIALLMSILLPTLGRVREQANRMKCASNLRQIATAALLYATDHGGKFPRTYYQQGVGLPNNTKGGPDNAPAANSFSLADPAGPVGASNVGASLYLLLKNGYVPPAVFMCPSNTAAEPIAPDYEKYSNFGSPYRKYSSYSYAAPFPNKKGADAGWRLTPASGPDWPIASDINPGKGGANYSDGSGQDVTDVAYNASRTELRRGNSNNHFNEGQAVAYADGHVEWSPTIFCGPARPGVPFRDNIFSNANGLDVNTGKGGGPHQQPCDRFDVVMHPGDGAN